MLPSRPSWDQAMAYGLRDVIPHGTVPTRLQTAFDPSGATELALTAISHSSKHWHVKLFFSLLAVN